MTTARRQDGPGRPGPEERVAFLSRPAAWPGGDDVEVVETHLSWVFLVGLRAYKLKKPIRWNSWDLRTLAARREDCEGEVDLNRRLAEDVYLGVVELTWTPESGLHVGGDGEVVDVLVEMRRLHRERMLDALIGRGEATPEDARRIIDKLVPFYASAERATWSGPEYRRRLREAIADARADLLRHGIDALEANTRALSGAALELLEDLSDALDRRVADGRVVEAHGDLRPEHIFLDGEPVIIDCLQFDRDLRTLDAVSELVFLGLECERLGAPELATALLEAWFERSGDAPPMDLLRLYRAKHALIRAKLAIWRLDEDPVHPRHWIDKANRYLRFGLRDLGRPAATRGAR